jgi:hypothetical protein
MPLHGDKCPTGYLFPTDRGVFAFTLPNSRLWSQIEELTCFRVLHDWIVAERCRLFAEAAAWRVIVAKPCWASSGVGVVSGLFVHRGTGTGLAPE